MSDKNFLDHVVDLYHTKQIEFFLPNEWKRANAVRLTGYQRIGGLTNKNFKIQLDSQQLVIRLPGRGVGRFISRKHEKLNQEAAAQAGFSPDILYFNQLNGVKIAPYLDKAKVLNPSDARNPEYYGEVAAFLRRFHTSGLQFSNTFNVFHKIRSYEKTARMKFARFYPGYKYFRTKLETIENLYHPKSFPLVACHNDLVPENILFLENSPTFIDWEYSGMNDPAWDLASFLLESELPISSEQDFLTRYNKDLSVDEDFLWRIKTCKVLQDFLWSIWSLIEENSVMNPRKAKDCRVYGEARFQRCCTDLVDLA